jgi:hypothetical protein
MSFQNTISNWLSADGIPVVYASNINLNNNVAVLMPSTTNFANFGAGIKPRAGYVRIKTGGTGPRINVTTKVGAIVATDGTNVANIYNGDANATSTNLFYDSSFFFWFDWGVVNINITNIATTLNTQTYDVEVAGMM